MAERPLRVLTFDENGEVLRDTETPLCPGCEEKLQRIADQELAIERLARSSASTIANLKRELDELTEKAVVADDVRRVFDHWSDKVMDCGWWSRPPKLSDGRKKAIQKRLSEGYTPQYLYVVMDSVMLANREDKRMKQAFLDIPALLAEPTKTRWGMEAVYEDTYEQLYAKPKRSLPEAEVNFMLEKLWTMRERWEEQRAGAD